MGTWASVYVRIYVPRKEEHVCVCLISIHPSRTDLVDRGADALREAVVVQWRRVRVPVVLVWVVFCLHVSMAHQLASHSSTPPQHHHQCRRHTPLNAGLVDDAVDLVRRHARLDRAPCIKRMSVFMQKQMKIRRTDNQNHESHHPPTSRRILIPRTYAPAMSSTSRPIWQARRMPAICRALYTLCCVVVRVCGV